MDCKEVNNVVAAAVVCIGHGVKVYPIVNSERSHLIQVSFPDGTFKTYGKILRTKNEVNDAMVKTYIHHAKEILKQKQDAKQTNIEA